MNIYLGSSAILFIGGLLFNGLIKEWMKRTLSSLSNKQVNIYFFSLLLIISIIPTVIGASTGVSEKQEPPLVLESNASESEINAELIKEGIGIASEGIESIVENKRIKDSIRTSNKSDLWVYQIGVASSDKDIVWDKYQQFEDDGSIYVFEKDRNTLFLIKDEGKSKQVLEDEKPQFENAIANIESRVYIINLATFCKAKQNIISSTDIKVKRKTFMKCRVCG